MSDKFAAWRQHFENQARGLVPRENTFYKISSTPLKDEEELFGKQIQIVPSTQQAIARAKSTLSDVNTIYDPVLGIQRHFFGRPQGVRKSSKSKPKKKKTKSTNKKKPKRSKAKSKK